MFCIAEGVKEKGGIWERVLLVQKIESPSFCFINPSIWTHLPMKEIRFFLKSCPVGIKTVALSDSNEG